MNKWNTEVNTIGPLTRWLDVGSGRLYQVVMGYEISKLSSETTYVWSQPVFVPAPR